MTKIISNPDRRMSDSLEAKEEVALQVKEQTIGDLANKVAEGVVTYVVFPGIAWDFHADARAEKLGITTKPSTSSNSNSKLTAGDSFMILSLIGMCGTLGVAVAGGIYGSAFPAMALTEQLLVGGAGFVGGNYVIINGCIGLHALITETQIAYHHFSKSPTHAKLSRKLYDAGDKMSSFRREARYAVWRARRGIAGSNPSRVIHDVGNGIAGAVVGSRAYLGNGVKRIAETPSRKLNPLNWGNDGPKQ